MPQGSLRRRSATADEFDKAAKITERQFTDTRKVRAQDVRDVQILRQRMMNNLKTRSIQDRKKGFGKTNPLRQAIAGEDI